jgi:hypothetical protein
MTTPLMNDIVDLADGTRQRLLAITPTGKAWLILLDHARALPHAEDYAWVCKHGKVVKSQTKDLVPKSLTASETARLRRDQAWERHLRAVQSGQTSPASLAGARRRV